MHPFKFTIAILFSLSAYGSIPTGNSISDEKIQIEIPRGSITCTDRIPNNGFGEVAGSLEVSGPLVDRSRRISATYGFSRKLPDTVRCADLRTELDSLPVSFEARRILTHFTRTFGNRRTKGIRAVVLIELPFKIAGLPAQLAGSLEWTQTNLPTSETKVPTLPFRETYSVLAHPQSATEGNGLFCAGSQLSIGYMSGYDGAGHHSNVDVGVARFSSAAECERTRSNLLNVSEATDPSNDGTPMRVSRALEQTYRYITNNAGKPTCQLIQLDTASTELRGTLLTGAKIFPLREVALQNCFPE